MAISYLHAVLPLHHIQFNFCITLLSSTMSLSNLSLSYLRGVEKVVWVPAEEYKEPVDEKRKRKKKESL